MKRQPVHHRGGSLSASRVWSGPGFIWRTVGWTKTSSASPAGRRRTQDTRCNLSRCSRMRRMIFHPGRKTERLGMQSSCLGLEGLEEAAHSFCPFVLCICEKGRRAQRNVRFGRSGWMDAMDKSDAK